MNGRVYDYNLGRFLSVDPFIQSPGNSQSMNPYSYIMNNPLAGTDPSGYFCHGQRHECDKSQFSERDGKGTMGMGPFRLSGGETDNGQESNSGSATSNESSESPEEIGNDHDDLELEFQKEIKAMKSPSEIFGDTGATNEVKSSTSGSSVGGRAGDGLPGCPDCRMFVSPDENSEGEGQFIRTVQQRPPLRFEKKVVEEWKTEIPYAELLVDYVVESPLQDTTEKFADVLVNAITSFGKYKGGTSAGVVFRYPVYEKIKRERAFVVTYQNFYDWDSGKLVNSFKSSRPLDKYRDVYLDGSRRTGTKPRALIWVPDAHEIKSHRWNQDTTRQIYDNIYH